jgi:hypothetical protein
MELQMTVIKKNKHVELKIERVMHFRGEVKKKELSFIFRCLDNHLSKSGAKKTGESVVAIHELCLESGIFEIDLFIQIDRTIPSSENFEYLEDFSRKNCIATECRDGETLLPVLFTKIYQHSTSEGLNILPPFYVWTKNPAAVMQLFVSDVDVYVCVS